MINLIRAEFLKIQKSTIVTIVAIGTLPALAFILLTMLAILGGLGLWVTEIDRINWQEQIILALLFANQFLSQGLFIILTAVTFGGESRWRTWKNILPRHYRSRIILSKYIVIALLIVISTQLMAILVFIGAWEISIFTNTPFVSGVWDNSELDFLSQYLWASLAIVFNFMIASIYASIVAIQTRSISAGIVTGLVISFADTLSLPAFSFISHVLHLDFIATIPGYLPNYNIQNILAWITSGETIYQWSLTLSALILVIWIIGGIGLSIYLFERLDID